MTDIPGWLRGFQRARVPSVTPPSDRLSLLDETNEAAEEKLGVPSIAETSSHQNFGRLTAASLSAENHPRLNKVDQIWHNPDPDQMAETLKVAMMTQNSFHPLNVPYNSCILHVLEAYYNMRKELLEKDRQIRDREQRHENDTREFMKQQQQWEGKEDEYRSELKKLEIMLATGERGLELVTLARWRSALDGTPRAGATESQQLGKESKYHNLASDEEPMMSDFAERKDSLVSASYTSQKQLPHARQISRQSKRSETRIIIGQPGRDAKHDNKNKANSDTTHFDQLYDMAHSETGSDFLSDLEQEAERSTEQHARSLRRLVNNLTDLERGQKLGDGSKPHPDVRIVFKEMSVNDSIEDEENKARLYYGKNLIGRPVAHHRGFSFIPGDDYGNLTLSREGPHATVLALEDRRRLSSSYLPSSNNFIYPVPPKKQRRIRPALGERGTKNTIQERKPNTSCEFEPTRDDSQTSTVPTVQDQYAGSGKCLELVRDGPGRPKPCQLSGSNEAIIAAVRAIAESGKASSRAP